MTLWGSSSSFRGLQAGFDDLAGDVKIATTDAPSMTCALSAASWRSRNALLCRWQHLPRSLQGLRIPPSLPDDRLSQWRPGLVSLKSGGSSSWSPRAYWMSQRSFTAPQEPGHIVGIATMENSRRQGCCRPGRAWATFFLTPAKRSRRSSSFLAGKRLGIFLQAA